MSGSLKTISQGLSFESEKLNLGVGGPYIPNTRLSIINNNTNSWKTAIFKNTSISDFITIGTFENNNHLSVINNDGTFKDLYLNNLGIASQPANLIGNIIINGKTTIGNNNNPTYTHNLDVYSKSANIAIFRNNDFNLSLFTTSSNINFNTNSKQVAFNSDVYTSGYIIGSNHLSNITNNPSSYKLPANWIKTSSSSCISTNAQNELELLIDTNNGLIINAQRQLSFTGTIAPNQSIVSIGNTSTIYTCNLYINDFITINSNNYSPNFNEKLFINGSVAIGSNSPNPTLNFNKYNYSLLVASNAYFNSNVNIAGVITGNGEKITNIHLSNITNNPNNYTFPSSWLNIDSTSGLYTQGNGKLSINAAQFATSAANSINFWNSNTPSIIYFNNGESYLGIGNTNPKSQLFVGTNGNLMRLTSLTNINHSHFSQIGTNDNDNNNTKIKLISPSADVSLSSGSIFYTISGNNPFHSFNYELDGNKKELLKIEKNGIILIGSSNNNNNYLQTYGKIIIGDSNAETTNYSLYINSNAKFNNKVIIGNVINSFEGFPMISEYPLNVYGNIGITGSILTTSDEKIKTNITTINNALDKILKCRGVSFNYINNSNNKPEIGVIAQEIEKILPDIVETDINGYKKVNYLSIIGYLIEAIKDLNNKINYIR